MANTVEVPLTRGVWTKVASGKSEGYITNEDSSPCIIREAPDLAPPPANSAFGHTLHSNRIDGYTYILENGQAVYARPDSVSMKIVVTPNI